MIKDYRRLWKAIFAAVLTLCLPRGISAEEPQVDGRRFVRRIDVELRPGLILRTSPFLRGENERGRRIGNALSGHLRYSLRARSGSLADRLFGGVYQGVGIAAFSFGERRQIGDPVALYLFQGARIAGSDRLALSYEWNLGVSAGWHPYDPSVNMYNVIIGSRVNAYIDAGVSLEWMLSRRICLTTGASVTHFSNGNTRFPNAGLNTAGLKAGVRCLFDPPAARRPPLAGVPAFARSLSYDLAVFASWRRKGIRMGENRIALPDAYPVAGFSFAPMYRLARRVRAGVSLDAVYDGSANICPDDLTEETGIVFLHPAFGRQSAMGLSARAEYVMPYFSVNMGLGVNVVHGGGDIKPFYQLLALKTAVTRSAYIHIGYSLQNFNAPNYLMLGLGLRLRAARHSHAPSTH
jgi:hypothetical protein